MTATGDPGRVEGPGGELGPTDELPEEVPVWEDGYVDRVSDRLMHNYDLEKDVVVHGERFTLYGRMEIHNQKHMFHPAISFAHHDLHEHLFARRHRIVDVDELRRLVELGHALADEWVEADENHYSTDFTFAAIVPEIPDGVGSFVESFKDRNLLKLGYHGHYEINLLVVAPDREAIVASPGADVRLAFALWESIETSDPGLLDLILRRLQL